MSGGLPPPLRLALVLLVLAGLAGCASPSARLLPQAADGTYEVALSGVRFVPGEGRVPAGATVRFLDRDGVHDVSDAEGEWSSNSPPSRGGLGHLLQPGESWSRTFATAGTFYLVCHQHHEEQMLMTLVVEE